MLECVCVYVFMYWWVGEWIDILFITIQSLAFSSLSPPRFLGQPAARSSMLINPPGEWEVVVTSLQLRDISTCLLFTAGCGPALKLRCGRAASFLLLACSFLLSAACLSFFCYPSSSLLCVFFSIYFFSCSDSYSCGCWSLRGKKCMYIQYDFS